MSSEWMKVMLDEVARKQAESTAAQAEEARREEEARTQDGGEKKPGEQVQR